MNWLTPAGGTASELIQKVKYCCLTLLKKHLGIGSEGNNGSRKSANSCLPSQSFIY